MRRMVNLPPGATAPHSNPLFHWINAHSLQFQQINYQPVVAGPQPAAVVAAAANRQQMVVLSSKPHRGDDICDILTASNEPRTPIDHSDHHSLSSPRKTPGCCSSAERLAFLCLLPLSAVTAPPVLGDRCQQLARANDFRRDRRRNHEPVRPRQRPGLFRRIGASLRAFGAVFDFHPRFVSLCAYRNVRFRLQSPGDAPRGRRPTPT